MFPELNMKAGKHKMKIVYFFNLAYSKNFPRVKV